MNLEIIGKVIILGYIILIGAIIINIIANILGITTWHDLIINMASRGVFKAIKEQKIISTVFQFILYPAVLGIIAYYAIIFFKLK